MVESYCVYVIELFDNLKDSATNLVSYGKLCYTNNWIVLLRKELRKCISYKGNCVVNLVNQRINDGMYC
jgi:hypothetical protein